MILFVKRIRNYCLATSFKVVTKTVQLFALHRALMGAQNQSESAVAISAYTISQVTEREN